MTATIADAIVALRPGAKWVLRGQSYSGLEWLDDTQSKPSEADVAALIGSVMPSDVNEERDRRLKSFPFGGKIYDFCDSRGSDINIAGAGTLALAAIMAGAQSNDMRWANPDVDFKWVAADNSSVTMDAQTCLNFAKAAADWKAKHIRKARALKDMSPIPADYASDSRWTS